jgi:acetyl-CoA carboxylase biotin carboxyl carrier protein
LRSGDFEIELRRGGHAGSGERPPALAPSAPPVPMSAPVAAPRPAASASAARTWPAGHRVVQAPMVGTFYRAPEPGARPFVEVGQSVSPGDTLCIIEVMKLMNSIGCECEGTVVEILVEDGQAVAHGQDLIVIAPR